MTTHTIVHASFRLERFYPHSPARVFRALSVPEAKFQWFGAPPEWETVKAEMDFRVGGTEASHGGPVGGPLHRYDALYRDIVPERRIVYTYDMHLDDRRISVSLAVMELNAEGDGTRLVLTEHGNFLDGYDDAGAREHGTGILLDMLGAYLSRDAA